MDEDVVDETAFSIEVYFQRPTWFDNENDDDTVVLTQDLTNDKLLGMDCYIALRSPIAKDISENRPEVPDERSMISHYALLKGLFEVFEVDGMESEFGQRDKSLTVIPGLIQFALSLRANEAIAAAQAYKRRNNGQL